MGTIPQKPPAPCPGWPPHLEMLAQPLLPTGSQPKVGLIPKFGHRPFPEPEERMKYPEFWNNLWEARFLMLIGRDKCYPSWMYEADLRGLEPPSF